MVLAADDLGHLVHVVLNDPGAFDVVLVDGLTALEVDVRVLLADLEHGPFGVERTFPEGLEVLGLEEPGQRLVRDDVDLLDDVGGPEAVEEMEERNLTPPRRQMGDDGQVLGWTDPAQVKAKPVLRADMTSLWSPKMDRDWHASERAETRKTVGSISPAILCMLGSMSIKPWEAVKVVVRAPAESAPWTAPEAPPSDCISMTSSR
jgi:hypothetical protein